MITKNLKPTISNKKISFSEDLLHYAWRFRLFPQMGLKTIEGESIEIISVGLPNKHAGPDFDQAKIKVGDTIWVGTVEIHLCSSDWNQHHHQQDKAYNNVILHVVYHHDKQITRNDGTIVPVLVLKDLIADDLISRYQQLVEEQRWIPCQQSLIKLNSLYINNWLSRVLIERFEEKYSTIDEHLIACKGSWDDAFYRTLARNFGFKTNAFPFELLAQSIPQQLFAKHKNSALQIEALVFGQAGFLTENLKDDYPRALRTEYLFLQKKYDLTPIDNYLWKFMRLRPQNFPTLRIAQFAALIVKANHLFSQIIHMDDIQQIRRFFEELPINTYWQTHYRFDISTKKFSNQLGKQSISNLLINTVSIFLFTYGKKMGNDDYTNRALLLLEKLSPEINETVSRYKEIGIQVDNASTSQALLQLKANYCDKKRCLHCGIGMKVLNV